MTCPAHGLPVVDRACGEERCLTCLSEHEAAHASDPLPPSTRFTAVWDQHHGKYTFEREAQ